MTTIQHWFGSSTDGGSGDRRAQVHDPATGEVLANVALADDDDVERVVGIAREAMPEWAGRSPAARAEVLFAFREVVRRDADRLAGLITAEHGKTLPDAVGEVRRGLEIVEFACGVPNLLQGRMSASASTGIDTYDWREPVGVVAGITPFNFPLMVPMWMHPIAIACGNVFVLKPSERVPSVSVAVARLWHEAGLPPGVFTVLQGDRQAAEGLLSHSGVDAVSFVGSTPVARTVYETAARQGKRAQALGGAKNHLVVLPDADLDAASDAAVRAAFGSAGQRCMAVSVVVAVEPIADELVERIHGLASNLELGPGTSPSADVGPLVSAEHHARVSALVDDGEQAGADLVLDGREVAVAGHEGGFWFGPTVFDRVDPSMRIYQEEIFGPVLSIVRVSSAQHGAELVRRNAYGNGAAIFTASGQEGRSFARAATAGMIGINVPIPVPVAGHSFGGWKDSLFGSSPIYGSSGMDFYTRQKVVTARWGGHGPAGSAGLAFPTTS